MALFLFWEGIAWFIMQSLLLEMLRGENSFNLTAQAGIH